jgi:hypothetical protein
MHFTFAWLEFPDESCANTGAVKNLALTVAPTTAPPYIHNSSPTGLISGSAPTFGKDSPTNSIPNCFTGFIGSRDGYPPSFLAASRTDRVSTNEMLVSPQGFRSSTCNFVRDNPKY